MATMHGIHHEAGNLENANKGRWKIERGGKRVRELKIHKTLKDRTIRIMVRKRETWRKRNNNNLRRARLERR